ncbi:hypothetical protein [Citreimonas salinaria]|uniref:Uncharacterized protein n=1 Tax=Citreimonas salinaria TaxID=321339 RepID=A0A1H3N7Y8_9RHOB|nr:hypothetical protein [Citreimonas salinaria]SDY84863.1 hypothetical protein SAMN05444340_12125 [Citreimonas salinaria]
MSREAVKSADVIEEDQLVDLDDGFDQMFGNGDEADDASQAAPVFPRAVPSAPRTPVERDVGLVDRDLSSYGRAPQVHPNGDEFDGRPIKKAVSPRRRRRSDRKDQLNVKMNPDLLQGFYDVVHERRDTIADVIEHYVIEYIEAHRQETQPDA